MKASRLFLATACAMLLSQGVHAANYNFDFTYNGSSVVVNETQAGNSFVVGDTVTATFHAAGADYWLASSGTMIWTPIFLLEDGIRVGDLSWSFLRHGVTVDSGASAGEESMLVHVPHPAYTSSNISFDTFTWSYVLTGSTATGNTFSSWVDDGLYRLSPAQYVTAVPEPETYTMLLAGLGLLGSAARRRRQA